MWGLIQPHAPGSCTRGPRRHAACRFPDHSDCRITDPCTRITDRCGRPNTSCSGLTRASVDPEHPARRWRESILRSSPRMTEAGAQRLTRHRGWHIFPPRRSGTACVVKRSITTTPPGLRGDATGIHPPFSSVSLWQWFLFRNDNVCVGFPARAVYRSAARGIVRRRRFALNVSGAIALTRPSPQFARGHVRGLCPGHCSRRREGAARRGRARHTQPTKPASVCPGCATDRARSNRLRYGKQSVCGMAPGGCLLSSGRPGRYANTR